MHLQKFVVLAFVFMAVLSLNSQQAVADDHDPIVIVYRDGHKQTLMSSQITRIDLKAPATILYKDGHREKLNSAIDRIEFGESHDTALPGRSHYIGKWEAGDGAGNTFYITLRSDGDAKKSIGSAHGTWTLVDGEAHIAWDDGWHDIIRKEGSRHEKLAFEPGKAFSDTPANVTEARNTERKPI